ncbi:hypothetical protein KKG36_01015 [Patescibacteria group bacterium]|nr:hypothetical protein [Patescibacteria group bacterium]
MLKFTVIKKLIFLTIVCFVLFPAGASADGLGEKRSFYIDSSYDLKGRDHIAAVLLKISPKAYFYADEDWWSLAPQNEIYAALGSLSDQFNNAIYPVLTSAFGSEWNPGIDKDSRITILIHPMIDGSGGYFRSNDEYYKVQVPGSNEREMVYLNSANLRDINAKSFLAHEFIHLITFNQKNKTYGIEEETWLNEMRAEYAPTILGYDDFIEGSYLQRRMQAFSGEPFNSLTEWADNEFDYGVVNLFGQYLVGNCGAQILIDSLHSQKIGIESLDYELAKIGKTFDQVFIDWTIASFINDCSAGKNYCYSNNNLKNFHIYPRINFLPLSGQSALSVTETTKDWAGNWFKIIGGKKNIKVSFVSNSGVEFKIPYILQKSDGSYAVKFLNLDKSWRGEFSVSDFGVTSNALIIIPSTKNKIAGFNSKEPSYSFTFTISAFAATPPETSISFSFLKNLLLGMRDQDVIHLKMILAQEGCVSGLANTNYFGPLTLAGVKCFQNKYKSQISQAAGYIISGTGFVGPGTRSRLNMMLPG